MNVKLTSHRPVRDRGRRGACQAPVAAAVAIWLIAGLALAGTVTAQNAAYTVADEELYRLDLTSGELTLLGDISAEIVALAIDPSGVLYGISPVALYIIDAELPAATMVGYTSTLGFPRSMTFDADGRLWIANEGALYEMDPTTGAASQIGVDQGLIALAARGVDLFGVAIGIPVPPETPSGPQLPKAVTVDKTNGVVQVLATLDDIGPEPEIVVEDMGFDPGGDAWILSIKVLNTSPPAHFHRIHRAVELDTGVVELISQRAEQDVSRKMETMALIPIRGVVDVPTLGWGGLGLLIALLAGFALRTLRGGLLS